MRDIEAENRRLRAALELAAGALQAGQKAIARHVVFTGRWSHLGTRSIADILDIADDALGNSEAT